jgi:hypothetical protein
MKLSCAKRALHLNSSSSSSRSPLLPPTRVLPAASFARHNVEEDKRKNSFKIFDFLLENVRSI